MKFQKACGKLNMFHGLTLICMIASVLSQINGDTDAPTTKPPTIEYKCNSDGLVDSIETPIVNILIDNGNAGFCTLNSKNDFTKCGISSKQSKMTVYYTSEKNQNLLTKNLLRFDLQCTDTSDTVTISANLSPIKLATPAAGTPQSHPFGHENLKLSITKENGNDVTDPVIVGDHLKLKMKITENSNQHVLNPKRCTAKPKTTTDGTTIAPITFWEECSNPQPDASITTRHWKKGDTSSPNDIWIDLFAFKFRNGGDIIIIECQTKVCPTNLKSECNQLDKCPVEVITRRRRRSQIETHKSNVTTKQASVSLTVLTEAPGNTAHGLTTSCITYLIPLLFGVTVGKVLMKF